MEKLLTLNKQNTVKCIAIIGAILLGVLSPAGNAFAQQQANELKPVTLQLLWKHQFEFAGFYAAQAKGFYQDAGLQVSILPIEKDDKNLVDKVVDGNVDFAVGNSSIILDRAQGKPVKLLANLFQHSPYILITLADSGIISPAQMVGKKIMLAKHEQTNAEIKSMMAVESVTLDQMQVIEHNFNVDSLINGEVDIMSAYASNEPGTLKQKGIKFNIINPLNYGIDFYGNNIYTSEQVIQTAPEMTKAFVDASLKGWQYALKNKNEIIDLILEQYSQHKTREALNFEADVIDQYIIPEHIPLGEINTQRMLRIVKTYQNLQLLDEDFELEALIYQQTNRSSQILLTDEEIQWIIENPLVTLGVDPDWAPFEFIDENGQYSGMASDFIKLVAEKTGLTFGVQKNDTWMEVISSAKSRKLNVLPAVSRSPQRDEFLDFVAPHISYPMVILTNKDSEFISQIDDLNGKQVIVVDGYVTEDLLRRNHPDINIIEAQNINQALGMLSSKDADAFIDNLASITHSINQRGFSNLRISGTTPYEFSVGLGLIKDQPMLFSILEKAINSISAPERKKIRDKWISVSIDRNIPTQTIIEIAIVIALFVLTMLFWNRKLSAEVSRRITYEKELAAKEKRFRELFENNKAPELIIDPENGEIIAANHSALNYYGYTRQQMTSLLISDINTLSKQQVDEEMQLAAKENRSHFFFKHKLANDEIRDVEVHSGPIEWDNKKLLYSIIHDITDRVVAENALISAKAEAEYATKIKSEFLANMSHEIRTPMNSVLGMADLLQQTTLDQDQQKMLSIIESSGKALISIINDILDFTKLEAHKMVVDAHEFQLLPFIDEIINTFHIIAHEKSLNLSAEYDDDCDVMITSDQTKLRQIFTNLLSNAIKFTERGDVILNLTLNKLDDTNAMMQVDIIDSGIGIEKEMFEHLFDSFTQAEQSTTRQYGGTGLGLAISKKLCELLDGEIRVSSTLGKGSQFTVEIPVNFEILDEKQKQQRTTFLKDSQTINRFNAKVLVVEDVLPNRILMQRMLKKFDINCDFAENGQQAVDKFLAKKYDLVLMDCQMPIMDGYSATQLIRQNDKETPVLALTANVTSEDEEKALASGMNEVITKPIQLTTLSRFLNHWLAAHINNEEQAADNNIMADSTLPVVNYKVLERLKMDMEEAFEEVYQAIFVSIDSLIGELELKPDDEQTIIRLFHSLKSPASSLGASQLADVAAQYEQMAKNNAVEDLDKATIQLREYFEQIKTELQDYRTINS